ncbi:MAG TPA: CDP-alcohol phosphatidyltransferase family protein [Polyangiaceae bacterium]
MVDLACSLALFACVLAIAAAYGVHVARTGYAWHARVERAGRSPLLGMGVQQMGYWAMRPAARACIALGWSANAISWASLVLAAAAGTALAFGRFGVGAALSAVSSVCDALDGMVARETGTASNAGEVLDATVDRYAELFFIGGVAYAARLDPVALLLAFAAAAGAVMVSYATAKAEALRVEAPRGVMRRQERAVYLVLGAALVPIAAAAAVRWALPTWVGWAPMLAAFGLVGVLGNASAVYRLRVVADRVVLQPRHRVARSSPAQ